MTTSLVSLRKLLIDRDFNKTRLQQQSGISAATTAKLRKGRNVTTNMLVRICEILGCQIGNICEVVPVTTKKAIS
ncbi:helix-turn-helix domain-containing protein [Corynebacterium parakroppenstedtii]